MVDLLPQNFTKHAAHLWSQQQLLQKQQRAAIVLAL